MVSSHYSTNINQMHFDAAASEALLRKRRDDWRRFVRFVVKATAAVAFILLALRVFLV